MTDDPLKKELKPSYQEEINVLAAKWNTIEDGGPEETECFTGALNISEKLLKETKILQAKIEELKNERDLARQMLIEDQTHTDCGIFQENQRKKFSQATKLIERLGYALDRALLLKPDMPNKEWFDDILDKYKAFLSPSPKLKEGE